MLPYLPVSRPTHKEQQEMTSTNNWNPNKHELSSIMPLSNEKICITNDPIKD